jgi:hypothetical protein
MPELPAEMLLCASVNQPAFKRGSGRASADANYHSALTAGLQPARYTLGWKMAEE